MSAPSVSEVVAEIEAIVARLDRPQPGDRVRHAKTGAIGTVLGLRSVDWPEYLAPGEWSYVRFDPGFQNYIPHIDLLPPRGCRDFAGRPDVGV